VRKKKKRKKYKREKEKKRQKKNTNGIQNELALVRGFCAGAIHI